MIASLSTLLDDLLRDGGPVAIALFGVCFLLWWVVYLRFGVVRSATTDGAKLGAVAAFVKRADAIMGGPAPDATRIDALHGRAVRRLSAWRVVLRSLVAAAPMLGLLGTVGGMIETFATLHIGGPGHADESVAGGISTALITTQLGLLIGVPGLVAARTLDRLEARRVRELAELKIDLLRRRDAPRTAP